MTGKTRGYIAVGGVCAMAFLVDRIWLSNGGPSRADASLVAGLPGGGVTAPLASQLIPNIAFPPVVNDANDVPPRDFFARAEQDGTDGQSGVASIAAKNGRLSHDSFREAATLGGAIVTGDGGIAVVNGKKMSPGDSLFGCTLEKILGRSAQFRCSDGVAVLFIAPRSPKTGN